MSRRLLLLLMLHCQTLEYEVLTYGSWLVASFFLGNWSLTGLFNKWEDNLPGNTDEKQPNQKEPA